MMTPRGHPEATSRNDTGCYGLFLLKSGTSAVDSRTTGRVRAETAAPQPQANYLFLVISLFMGR